MDDDLELVSTRTVAFLDMAVAALSSKLFTSAARGFGSKQTTPIAPLPSATFPSKYLTALFQWPVHAGETQVITL